MLFFLVRLRYTKEELERNEKGKYMKKKYKNNETPIGIVFSLFLGIIIKYYY